MMIFANLDKVKAKLAMVEPAKCEELSRELDLTFEEHFAWQEAQSVAHASGKLDLNVASDIYETLGNNYTHFNSQPLEKKIIVTQVMALVMTQVMAITAASARATMEFR